MSNRFLVDHVSGNLRRWIPFLHQGKLILDSNEMVYIILMGGELWIHFQTHSIFESDFTEIKSIDRFAVDDLEGMKIEFKQKKPQLILLRFF